MLCPSCNTELRISKSRVVFENDTTPDAQTKAYIEQELTCVNKNCPNHGKVVETVRNPIE